MLDPATLNWTNLGAIQNPALPNASGRGLYAMAYDTVLQGALLYGGRSLTSSVVTTTYGDTWVFSAKPVIVGDPSEVTSCFLSEVRFSVDAAGTGLFGYRWQWRIEGPSAWVDVVDGENIDPRSGEPSFVATGSGIREIGVEPIGMSFAVAGPRREFRAVVSNACGSRASNPARLTICIGEFNCDGGTDGADVEAFFAAWEAGLEVADVNVDGGVDGLDLATFFAAWEGGC
ncbi:MAG: hypothetical protein JSR77_02060 [Planctomycetes bacterium]|nr:hypothetical protein [Planctomycetota bacterium]